MAALGKKAIKAILELMEYLRSLEKDIQSLDRRIGQVLGEDGMSELMEIREALSVKKDGVEVQLQEKRGRLGLEDEEDLRKLMGNKYLEMLLKARAVKGRLRARLQNRKFEYERLEKAYHRASFNGNNLLYLSCIILILLYSESRLQDQIQSSISKQQPGIVALMNRYNQMCHDLQRMITQGQAPTNAVAPRVLQRESLFKLDVDDPIWDDSGLEEQTGDIPPWLGDEEVQEGIKAWLVINRGKEELERLIVKGENMQRWMRDEWTKACTAWNMFEGKVFSLSYWCFIDSI